jgi:hypothetical protein
MLAKVLVASVLVAGLSWAEDSPGRGVARISIINGDVSIHRGDSNDVIAAAVNAPVVVQDRLLTGPTSRAEVQFDWANMIRLGQDAEIRLAELEYKRYIIQVARGTTTFRVLRDHDADVELSTPSIAVRPVKRGVYRVTVLDDGSSEITVRSGEAEVFTPRGSERLKSGRTMLARGTTADPEYRFVAEVREDEWDRWNERRDKDLDRSRSYQYVSRDIYGADDLDDHGNWVRVQDHGWVWSPRVAVGWAPYRYGRWSWVDYYGWSWISHDPWGWAPYHYGRWFYRAPYGWCWWPGQMNVRHHWSPGLVAFFGYGSVRAGVGFGNIGWVPLAPHERYNPWYGRGYYGGYRNRAYVDNSVRIVNNVNVTNVYRNARVRDGVTAVDHDGFRGGRGGRAVGADVADLRRASTFDGRLPISPERASLRLADREPGVRPATTDRERQFFSRRGPARVDKVSFDEQQSGMREVARRTFGSDMPGGEVRPLGRSGDGSANPRSWRSADAPPVGTGGRSAGDDGWRRFGSPRVDDAAAVPSGDTHGSSSRRVGSGAWRSGGDPASQQPGTTDDNWRRFGSPRVDDAPPVGTGGRRSFDSSAQPSAETPGTSSPRDRGGWRRMGEPPSSPSTPAAEVPQQQQRNSDTGNTWRGWGGRSAEPRAQEQQQQPRESSLSGGFGGRRGDRPAAGMERRGESGGDSVRISPPIVRERGWGDGGGRGSFGSGRAAPQPSSGPSNNGGGASQGSSPGAGGRGGGSRGR